jgi:hypothetical protein
VTEMETGSGEPDAFDRWRNALAETLHSTAGVTAWQDRRYSFAHQVGQLLASPPPGGTAVTDHVVYGVNVEGGGLVYVGQTADAKRRLRDLPVGEKPSPRYNHSARSLGARDRHPVAEPAQPAARSGKTSRGPAAAADMRTRPLEYLLQVAYRPVMSARRRSTKGGWSAQHRLKPLPWGSRKL